jgi:hypothetical protein
MKRKSKALEKELADHSKLLRAWTRWHKGDGRSPWSRRYRDLIAGHISDMGGRSVLSEAQLSLIKRASAIELELEQMEGKLSKGETIDIDIFTRTASHLRRILETLGLERRQRDITPKLGAMLREGQRR